MSKEWERKVEEWLDHEVTKQFFVEVSEDVRMLTEELIASEDTKNDMELKGMIKSLRGVLDMGTIDNISPSANYLTKEQSDESGE